MKTNIFQSFAKQILGTIIKTCALSIPLFLCLSCKNDNKQSSKENEERNPSLLKCLNCFPNLKPKYDPPYDYLEIIKLETTRDCLLDGLIKLEMTDSLIFYMDRRDNLFIFNRDGLFISKVGQKGQGPQDYIRLNTFFIHHNQVVLIDEIKGLLLYYDFNGKFISSISINNKYLRNMMNVQLIDDSHLLICYMISGRPEENTSYSILDLNTKTIKWLDFTYNPIKLDNYHHYFSLHQMAKMQDEIHFIMPLCDTIYSYSDSLVSAKYITKTHDKVAKKEQIEYNTKEFHRELFRLDQQGYFVGFNAIYETEHIIILYYDSMVLGYYMFDKNTNEGNFYYHATGEEVTEVPFYRIVQSLPNNQFVAVENLEFLIPLMEDIKGNNKDLLLLKTIVENSEEDDNPLIFIYGFNK